MDKLDRKLRYILKQHKAQKCPTCERIIDRGDVAWRSASTEYGTGYCTVDIVCQGCDTSIAHVDSWYPSVDDFEEALIVLEDDWRNDA